MAPAQKLASHIHEPVLVLALPRGGVPVALPIADALSADFDVLVVRKLGVPGHEELAFGAIAGGEPLVEVLNRDVISALDLSQAAMNRVREKERERLESREISLRGERPAAKAAGKTVVIVDDGLATGATMMVAVEAIRMRSPRRIVVAAPVAPPGAVDRLREVADRVVCDQILLHFRGVGAWYADFSRLSDRDVRKVLDDYWAAE